MLLPLLMRVHLFALPGTKLTHKDDLNSPGEIVSCKFDTPGSAQPLL